MVPWQLNRSKFRDCKLFKLDSVGRAPLKEFKLLILNCLRAMRLLRVGSGPLTAGKWSINKDCTTVNKEIDVGRGPVRVFMYWTLTDVRADGSEGREPRTLTSEMYKYCKFVKVDRVGRVPVSEFNVSITSDVSDTRPVKSGSEPRTFKSIKYRDCNCVNVCKFGSVPVSRPILSMTKDFNCVNASRFGIDLDTKGRAYKYRDCRFVRVDSVDGTDPVMLVMY